MTLPIIMFAALIGLLTGGLYGMFLAALLTFFAMFILGVFTVWFFNKNIWEKEKQDKR